MSKGYEIPITLPGVDQALKQLDALAEKLKYTETASESAIRAAKAGPASERTMRTASAETRGTDPLRRGSGTMREVKMTNPWDRLEAAQSRVSLMERAKASMNSMKGANLELERAKRQVDQAEKLMKPKEPADPLRTMFMRTRLKIGPWHPLVGDLVKNGLLDESKIDQMLSKVSGSPALEAQVLKMATTVVPRILGAVSVIGAVGGAMSMANEWGGRANQRNFDYTSAGLLGGSTGRDSMQAFGMGRFMGMGPMETAALSIQLGESLRAGGPAAGRLRSQGIVDLGRNTLNKFDNLIKVMDALAKMPEKEAGYMARELGLPAEMLTWRYLSKDLQNMLKDNPPLTEQEKRQAAEKRAAGEIRQKSIENYERMWAPYNTQTALRDAENMKGNFAGGLKHDFYALTELAKVLNPVTLYDAIVREFMTANGWNKLDGAQKSQSEVERNTEELKKVNRTLKESREIVGGGRRASSAVPAGWRYEQLSEGLAGMSRALGAFTI